MAGTQIVLDTNVVVAALRSNRGASHRLLSMVGVDNRFEINLSVPVLFEYEATLKRAEHLEHLGAHDVDDVLDYLCSVANLREIYFLWRPVLRDPKDDMLLELAVEASCEVIVTHNLRDFEQARSFGIRPLTPREFLKRIGEIR
jgi:putative PIN family toxin of toxin-antitoxin system